MPGQHPELPDDPFPAHDLNLPYESLPSGPEFVLGGDIQLEDTIICGGVIIKAIALDVPGLGWRPGLVFSFHEAVGIAVKPILFMTENDDSFKAIKQLTYKAVNDAMNAAREQSRGQQSD